MLDYSARRREMVDRQIAARGVRSGSVLQAMNKVPRELFLSQDMQEFAYEDSPLGIAAGQTISQPYIVALMTEALDLKGGERVLEIGTGSGYAAAVLGEIAAQVYTIERIDELAKSAAALLDKLGYANVHVIHGDGTLGWEPAAPYDAIIVAAGGPEVPETLKQQLKVGGRLVIPVGSIPRAQELVRVTRISKDQFRSEDIADVRFVPLVGKKGWKPEELPEPVARPRKPLPPADDPVKAIAGACTSFESVESADIKPLIERIGDCQVVLLGEATHGTSEFYRMRARITEELIKHKGFRFVAIEGDWPDVARIDHYIRHFEFPPSEWTAFSRFPTWMWRNNEVRGFVDWLHAHNAGRKMDQRIAIYGLDLYSLYTSIRSVLEYLDAVDSESAQRARQRYACLTPWQSDPAAYGHAALTGRYHSCEGEVVRVLSDMLHKRSDYAARDGERFLEAVQNARLIANAEQYYRIMFYGSRASWNLRDQHMFETLKTLIAFHGPKTKAIIWAHNSHVGNAAATEMSARGELNIGQLCRSEYGARSFLLGFGTHTGTVAAASDWDGPMEVKAVVPSLPGSYERLCHESGRRNFMLPLRRSPRVAPLAKPRLERAIGVVYRPETELASHYFQAILPQQFDEYVWFDETKAVTPFKTRELEGLPDTYPFGL
jgi:protein-L-isoaspartate(D-aspartate) O-methyltransferase